MCRVRSPPYHPGTPGKCERMPTSRPSTNKTTKTTKTGMDRLRGVGGGGGGGSGVLRGYLRGSLPAYPPPVRLSACPLVRLSACPPGLVWSRSCVSRTPRLHQLQARFHRLQGHVSVYWNTAVISLGPFRPRHVPRIVLRARSCLQCPSSLYLGRRADGMRGGNHKIPTVFSAFPKFVACMGCRCARPWGPGGASEIGLGGACRCKSDKARAPASFATVAHFTRLGNKSGPPRGPPGG